MEQNLQLMIFELIAVFFFLAWIWVSILLARLSRSLEKANKSNLALHTTIEEYKLTESMIGQLKLQWETLQTMLEALKQIETILKKAHSPVHPPTRIRLDDGENIN